MTIPEIAYVMEHLKGCIQERADKTCTHDCEKCSWNLEYASLMEALDSIMNLVFRADNHSRRH